MAIPSGQEGQNRLHKIQPIIDHSRKKFTDVSIPETHQAIDEMMVSFKDRHGAKMCMPKKTDQVGIQNLVSCWNIWVRV